MDMEPQGSQDGSDGAERAFEALRGEVATQGRLLQRVAGALEAQAQRPAPLMPDYSPTLGSIAKSLQAVQVRLQAIEEKPALMATTQDYRQRMEEAGRAVGKSAERALRDGAAAQKAASEVSGNRYPFVAMPLVNEKRTVGHRRSGNRHPMWTE